MHCSELVGGQKGFPYSILLNALKCSYIISFALTGISLEMAAVTVKEESEDPDYYQYNIQGNTV